VAKKERTKRKTTKERLLHARLVGFGECLDVFMESWRKRVWNLPGGPKAFESDPVSKALWDLIQAAEAKMRPTDDEWRKLFGDRLDDANKKMKKEAKRSKKIGKRKPAHAQVGGKAR